MKPVCSYCDNSISKNNVDTLSVESVSITNQFFCSVYCIMRYYEVKYADIIKQQEAKRNKEF